MTTVQETTIAQNRAIILLLQDILKAKGAKTSLKSRKAITLAENASEGWIEQLEANHAIKTS